jgi:uncharacterized protein YdhG (YjbR/CyaY superfamily)
MKKPKTIDEYIYSFPLSTKKILNKIRETVFEIAPDAQESIAYGMPGFKINGKPLCYFASFKTHIGFYPIPSGIKAFHKELAKYKTGKGSVQFPLDEEIPYTLIKKILLFRKSEMEKSAKKLISQ